MENSLRSVLKHDAPAFNIFIFIFLHIYSQCETGWQKLSRMYKIKGYMSTTAAGKMLSYSFSFGLVVSRDRNNVKLVALPRITVCRWHQ